MAKSEPLKCTCGADPRVRYRYPYAWVECKRKCGMSSGFVSDVAGDREYECKQFAIELWNKKVSKDG